MVGEVIVCVEVAVDKDTGDLEGVGGGFFAGGGGTATLGFLTIVANPFVLGRVGRAFFVDLTDFIVDLTVPKSHPCDSPDSSSKSSKSLKPC